VLNARRHRGGDQISPLAYHRVDSYVLNARRHRGGDQAAPPLKDWPVVDVCSTPEGIEAAISREHEGCAATKITPAF